MAKKIDRKDFVKARVHVHVTPGEMLKTLRELHNMTQGELAEKAGMTQSNLSALETNARQIGRERALALAKALKVHPAVILFPDYDANEVVA
ncbi:MAG: helix-turn-helix transcriptional regulator [Calothrix sp. SM1_5_4]|nr:helix-turn-helix transcriptional regulator [Calothrix sp. SM1_5_4]